MKTAPCSLPAALMEITEVTNPAWESWVLSAQLRAAKLLDYFPALLSFNSLLWEPRFTLRSLIWTGRRATGPAQSILGSCPLPPLAPQGEGHSAKHRWSESPPSSLPHSLPRKAAEGAAAKTSHLLEAQLALVLTFSVPSPIYSRHHRNTELKLLPLLQMSSQQPFYSTITSSSYSCSPQHPHVPFAPTAARHQALRCQLFATSFSCFSWAMNHLLSSKCQVP